MIIDCISDLHGYYPNLKGGDILLLCGDYTATDKLTEWAEFFAWLEKQPYRKKILVAGNHDNFLFNSFPKNKNEAEELKEVQDFLQEMGEEVETDFEYLCDSGTEFEGLKIWGTPWTAQFPRINPQCCAFTVKYHDKDENLEDYWKKIPNDIDILISHSPPYGIFDKIKRIKFSGRSSDIDHVGSMSLRNHVISRIKPKLHIFGHIHECGGQMIDCVITKFVNASYLNEHYEPVHDPVRIIL